MMGFLKLSRNQCYSHHSRENSWGLWASFFGFQEAVPANVGVGKVHVSPLVQTWLITLMFIDVISDCSRKSSRWPISEAISTGSEQAA